MSRTRVLSAEDVLSYLSEIATADAFDFVELSDDGTVRMKPLLKIPPKKRHAAALVKNTSVKNGGVEIKLYDKMKALELLGKHYGLFTADVGGDDDTSERLESIFAELSRVNNGEE